LVVLELVVQVGCCSSCLAEPEAEAVTRKRTRRLVEVVVVVVAAEEEQEVAAVAA
jgi:hypothetical protein